jgi:hypothetical protein
MATPVDFDLRDLGFSRCDACYLCWIDLLRSRRNYSGFVCNLIVSKLLKTGVIGKICPRCGEPGSIVYQTKERIVFECPNGHQFEMKQRKNRNTGKSLA